MASTAKQQNYDVVIVGGAVNGSATAYFLANNPDFNGSVLVIERDWTYNKSATALSSSSIRQQFSNPINIEISRFGAEFVRSFPEVMEVDGDRPDLAFHENGYLFLGDDKGYEVLRRLHDTQVSHGADVHLLDPEQLQRTFPWVNIDSLAGASYGRSGEGWFDSLGMLNGFRRKARSMGIEYIENEVVSVQREGDRITGVQLASGERIGCGLLVNCAGLRTYGPFLAHEWADEQDLLEVNVLALSRLCHAIGNLMAVQGGGQILNVAGLAGVAPGPWMAAYAASKAYVLSFSQALREELKRTGIKVSVLCPGPVRSSRRRIARLDGKPRCLSPEEVALYTVRALDKNRALIMPGRRNRWLALAPRLLPRWLVCKLAGAIHRRYCPAGME